jgi:hypothetical protein
MFRRKIVYIPVVQSDSRSYKDKWADNNYLRTVQAMGRNDVFLTEVPHALEEMRKVADVAKTPDELAGINSCIRLMRSLLLVPTVAKMLLEASNVGE